MTITASKLQCAQTVLDTVKMYILVNKSVGVDMILYFHPYY